MPAPAVVTNIKQRREQLAAGKCYGLVAARVPHTLVTEVRQAAERADTSMSDWLMRAVIEKIVNDERKAAARETLAEAKSLKPEGLSDALWNEMVRAEIDKMATGKKRR